LTDKLSHISPHLRLQVSKRARRMALRLDTKERVVYLVVPRRADMTKARDFAKQYKHWIQEKIDELPDPVPFHDGTIIPLFGRNVEIRVNYDSSLKRTSIELKPRILLVNTNKKDQKEVSDRIMRFLKKEATRVIRALAVEKAARTGKVIANVSVRDTRSRWGSCAEDGNLSFSWRLIFAPWEALDYVVAHEVAHLVHMNHGKPFWNLCAKLSTDYDTGRDWMRDHGHELMSFGH
jgi:predicted metal-dependent hydrolase